MRISRYRGASLKEALARVKAELGPEAVLLSSRTLSPKEAKPGQKVELTVALDDTSPAGPEGGSLEEKLCLNQIREDLAHIRGLLAATAAKEFIPQLVRSNSSLRLFFERLLAAGVEARLALELIESLMPRLPARPGAELVYQELSRVLSKALVVAAPEAGKPIRWALVGPTGTGKTTTLAKLAARFALSQGRSVGLISVDNYRLAATEQLAAYGRLMGLELKVAYNRDELRQALQALREREVILLDTAGRSPNHLLNMNELKMLLGDAKELEKWLVLPATSKDRDLAAATRRFMEVGLSGLIFTKLDETDRYGDLINQVLRFRLPVAYLSSGQRVPEDIVPATRERLLRLVLDGQAPPKERADD